MNVHIVTNNTQVESQPDSTSEQDDTHTAYRRVYNTSTIYMGSSTLRDMFHVCMILKNISPLNANLGTDPVSQQRVRTSGILKSNLKQLIAYPSAFTQNSDIF